MGRGTPLCSLSEKDLKIVKDFIKREIAVRNAVYYPFLINLPLNIQSDEKIQVEGRRNKYGQLEVIDRHWFYYEVEIISRVGVDTSLVLGLLPAPAKDTIDIREDKKFIYPEEAGINRVPQSMEVKKY